MQTPEEDWRRAATAYEFDTLVERPPAAPYLAHIRVWCDPIATSFRGIRMQVNPAQVTPTSNPRRS